MSRFKRSVSAIGLPQYVLHRTLEVRACLSVSAIQSVVAPAKPTKLQNTAVVPRTSSSLVLSFEQELFEHTDIEPSFASSRRRTLLGSVSRMLFPLVASSLPSSHVLSGPLHPQVPPCRPPPCSLSPHSPSSSSYSSPDLHISPLLPFSAATQSSSQSLHLV